MSHTILLVEDEEQQRFALRLLFESEGYSVLDAESAEDAYEHLKKESPTVVVTDVKLTGMDGITFFEDVRKDPRFQRIPFVFITGYNDPAAISELEKLDSVAYVTKPYNLDDLLKVVRRFAPSDSKPQ